MAEDEKKLIPDAEPKAGATGASAAPAPSTSGAPAAPVAPQPPVPGAPAPAAPAPAGTAPAAPVPAPEGKKEDAKPEDAAKAPGAKKEEEQVLIALLSLVRKKLGSHFKETRQLVILAVVCLLLIAYLMFSSKYLLDWLRSEDTVLDTATEKTVSLRFKYPPECIDGTDIICLPEVKYLKEHLSGDPCDDLYSYICNNNYFYSADRSDYTLWPYRYANLEYAYTTLARFIEEDLKDFKEPVPSRYEKTGLIKTAMFIKNCTSEEDSQKHHVGHLKRALYDTGLPSSPYEHSRPEKELPDVAEALATVMLQLDIKVLFTIDFVLNTDPQLSSSAPGGKLVLVKKLPLNRKIVERRRDAEGTERSEFIYNMLKVRHFIPPTFKLYDYIGQNFYDLSDTLAKESVSTTTQETTRIMDVQYLPGYADISTGRFDWVKFFNTLLRDKAFKFDNTTKVALHDYNHLKNVMNVILGRSRHDILNYILLFVWSYYIPLMPKGYTAHMRYLPNTDFTAITIRDGFQSCMKLAEHFCPKGMLALNREVLMDKEGPLKYLEWEGSIVDFYANRLNEFALNFLTSLMNRTLADHFMAKYITNAKIQLAFPYWLKSKTVRELECLFDVDQVGANQTLFYFKDVVSKTNELKWHQRFFTKDDVYVPPVESNFVYDVSFRPGEVFIPMPYILPMIKYDRLKEVYMWMSLPDIFHAFVRTLFREQVKMGTLTTYGEEITNSTEVLGRCVSKLVASYMNLSDFTLDAPWFLGDSIIYKFMAKFTMTAWTRVGAAQLKGFDPHEVAQMPFLLMAEVACRKYLVEDITWDTMLYFSLYPATQINLAFSDYASFISAFNCTPGSRMHASLSCSMTNPTEDPQPITISSPRISFFY
ncbi:uncharacterized protein LOC135399541 [Ornithodoros turicata]|uniref:uncharacterized protein LOC135399541 n=1 Tax=Ornithodoros turicata TaxID=34597 RepID=UPI00313A36BC